MKLTRILKGSRIAEIDKKAMADGIDSKLLMKNAGSGISKKIVSDFENKTLKRAARGLVICGSGNNGGDGFVAAGDLLDYGMKVSVFYLSPVSKFSPDSLFYFEKLRSVRGNEIYFLDLEDNKMFSLFEEEIRKADFIADAIFGTGLHGDDIRGPSKEVIGIINSARKQNSDLVVYSVDIPSGIDSDSGKVLGTAVRADKTITFGCKKIGLVNYPGADFTGEIEIIDIGIPEKYYGRYEQIFEPGFRWVAENIPEKESWTYKHRVGNLLVIAGSIGFTGAASMTCMGALRSGAGMVSLICPRELNDIYEEKLTEVITYPVEQTEDISIHPDSLDKILELAGRFDALAVGPGLSKNPDTMHLVRELLKKIKKPLVLDADALSVFYGQEDIKKNGEYGIGNPELKNVVITPHSGEMSSIRGVDRINPEDRIKINMETAKKYKLISVLKGAGTIISDYNDTTFINPTGNWGLASAGTGDILTGIIGSLLCQGMGPLESAVCGVYIHGMAADIMIKETSRTSLIATDLLEGLKRVFLEIEKVKYKDI
ncbi:MAG: NAD(P)H-hydrate dehydratase [Actinomycetota bacterium]|nr:NAD(P)H-hydrate dehydratase [Actinomycetota bacterium]